MQDVRNNRRTEIGNEHLVCTKVLVPPRWLNDDDDNLEEHYEIRLLIEELIKLPSSRRNCCL